MENIRILEASEVTVDEYRELRLEALKEEPQAFGSAHKDQVDLPIKEWQSWLDRYIEGKNNWMVFASRDNKLIGMLGAFQTKENIENKSAQIIAVYVTKEARGKGVSKLLMKKLLEILKPLVKKVTLSVNINQIAAVKLYESFDFKIVGKENIVLGDGINHEEYLMSKEL